MWAIILFAAVAVVPHTAVVEDRCDVVEINHFYDDNGRLVFDQLIYWDWSDAAGRYEVRAWRLLKSCNQIPMRDRQRGGYAAVWHDGDQLRVVRHRSTRETWSQYDPELLQRPLLATEDRKEFTRERPPPRKESRA